MEIQPTDPLVDVRRGWGEAAACLGPALPKQWPSGSLSCTHRTTAWSKTETKDESKQISSFFFSPLLLVCLFHLEIIAYYLYKQCTRDLCSLLLKLLKYKGNKRNHYPVPWAVFACLITFQGLTDSLHLEWNPFLLHNTSLYGIMLYCFSPSVSFTNSINEPLGVAKCVWLHAEPRERIMEQVQCKQPQFAHK